MDNTDIALGAQVLGAVAAALAAGAAWRSAHLSRKSQMEAQRARLEHELERYYVMRAELSSQLDWLEDSDRLSLNLRRDRALRKRLTDLVIPMDMLPRARAFDDLNHDTTIPHLQEALDDIAVESAWIEDAIAKL